ncbi:MAG: AMP-binding protein [Geodermatophilaceae bacterium]|nr:AMP-binding protein [Geodermatophilaceae bacterium]MDQ3466538.1 fatty acid CoA ligase family protein [Actinomycetota bacterium]
MTDGSLVALLREAAGAHPARAALVLPTGRRHTPGPGGFTVTSYAELLERTDTTAARLAGLGIGPGMRTALMVPPDRDFFALTFALLRIGAVPILIDPGIGLVRVRRCLAEVAPEAFVGVPRAHLARLLLRWCPSARLLVTVGRGLSGAVSLGKLPPAQEPLPEPAADQSATAAIAFTSGSTGPPKGVEYRQSHFLAQIELIRSLYDVRAGEVSLSTFPPFALFGPALGLTTVIPRMNPSKPARADPARIADAANGFGATLMFGSPALLDTVGRWGAVSGARMPTLTRVLSAGAPVTPAVQRRFLAMLGPEAEIHTPYGATEALPVTSIGSRDVLTLTEPGICVGRPVAGVDLAILPITDEPMPSADRFLSIGETGEIVVRGPNVTASYAERPAGTAAAKTRWDDQLAHRMGDLGFLDPAGRLWFCGRKAHRVLTANGPMFTVPCEAVFNAHPAVFRSALVGVGPPDLQRPVLCVELEPAAGRRTELTAQLLALGASHEHTAMIRTVLYHRGFPVDIRHNAKIDRVALARWAARRLRT